MTDGIGTTRLESVARLHLRDGRLLGARTRGREVFYLPGGKYEPGETGPQALARELVEETGLTVAPDEFAEAFAVEDEAHGLPGVRLRMTCFTGGPAVTTPEPGREIAELAWLEHADAPRCAPAVRQVLARLAAGGLLR